MGDLLLWTNFECGFGIIAGSLTMPRKLFKSLSSTEGKSSGNNTPRIDLVTVGGGGGAAKRSWNLNKHPYEADITVLATANGDEEDGWDKERDDHEGKEGDDESTRKMIWDERGRNGIRVTGRFERKVSMRDGGKVEDGARYHGF